MDPFYTHISIILRLKDPNPQIREAAAKNLVFADWNEKTIHALADALNDPIHNVRRAAGTTLFVAGSAAKHVVPELIAALDNGDNIIRRIVAATLSHVGSHGCSAISKLTELKKSDDDKLRGWVAEALKCIDEGGP